MLSHVTFGSVVGCALDVIEVAVVTFDALVSVCSFCTESAYREHNKH